MKKLALAGLALMCGVAATIAPAQASVVGVADTSSSYPFGSSGGGYYYQQIYSAASLAGTTSINSLSFHNSQSPTTTTPLADTFTIFLSTTTAAISTFDTSAFAFPDGSFTQVFSGKLSSLVNGRLDILLSTVFNYDPSQGGLMLTVRDFDLGSGGNLFLDADKNVGVTNSRISAFPYDFNQGLVTGFNEAAAAAVPEPATWAMMLAGFGMVGFGLRRRGAVRTAVSFT